MNQQMQDQMLGGISADVKTLLGFSKDFAIKLDKMNDKKADKVVVNEVSKKLDDHLEKVEEIIAIKTRPWRDDTVDNANNITDLKDEHTAFSDKFDDIERKLWKFFIVLSFTLGALQFFYNIYGDKIQSFLGV